MLDKIPNSQLMISESTGFEKKGIRRADLHYARDGPDNESVRFASFPRARVIPAGPKYPPPPVLI